MTFTEEQSTLIIANCRKDGITFSAAFPILGQLGGSRLLHRKYIRGGIDKDEWEWRRIQPCNTLGPLNCRPYLDKDWYANGGSEVVALGISHFFNTHPFMPSVSDEWIAHNRHVPEDDAPPFSALLSQGRFVLRSNIIKGQFKKLLAPPLLFEIASAMLFKRIPLRKQAARLWVTIHEGGGLDEPEKHIPSVLTDDVIYHHGGSSMRNVSTIEPRIWHPANDSSYQIDPLRPTEYPLDSSNPLSSQKYYPQPKPDQDRSVEPTIWVVDSWRKLRPRPTELYLGSITQNRKLSIFVSWDGNTYEDSMVEEWLREIELATHHYLCQPLI